MAHKQTTDSLLPGEDGREYYQRFPVLFLIFINDLESGIMNWILIFADNTKMLHRAGN